MDPIAVKFDYVLQNYGHNIFLRKDRDGEITWEQHTVRSRYPAIRGLPQTADEQEEGLVHTIDMLFYFKAEALPREGDRIHEADPRYSDSADSVQYIVDYALPNRGLNGEVVYYTVGVTRDVPD